MSEPSNTPPGAATTDGGDALPAGTRLAEFEIREVIGAGGFGIVYRAWDEALQRDVALKEYMPVSLAGRSAGERVTLRSRTNEDTFALGLQSFVNEARLLARFDQPALVKVFRFWEGNGTAYMAMPLYQGRTLRQLRKEMAPGTLNDTWMRGLIEPLLGALEVMHGAAVYHRDIAPDNILWCDDGRPVLLDFGAARLVLADRTQNVTAVLKPQFAPIEQYAETQSMRQGPWTDLYALAGTCYFMLTGRAPLPATARVMSDELEPLARLAPAGCSPLLLQVLDWAMAVRPQDRPQSVAQMRDALAGRIPVPALPMHGVAAGTPASTTTDPSAYEKTMQATTRFEPTRKTPRPAPAPSTRSRPDSVFDTPERSVMLPPKSGLPLRAVLLVLVVATLAAGAWATRREWIPMLPEAVRTVVAPADGSASAAEAAAPVASAVEASASAAASAPVGSASAAAPVAQAASPVPLEVASATAPDAQHVATEDAASAPAAVATPEAAPARPTHAKPASRRTPARAPSIALPPPVLPPPPDMPPPVLPPANESQVGTPAHVAAALADPAMTTSTAAPHPLGPREVCKDQDPAKVGACVKRLCDNEPRYRNYPICQRVRQKEETQQRESTE